MVMLTILGWRWRASALVTQARIKVCIQPQTLESSYAFNGHLAQPTAITMLYHCTKEWSVHIQDQSRHDLLVVQYKTIDVLQTSSGWHKVQLAP